MITITILTQFQHKLNTVNTIHYRVALCILLFAIDKAVCYRCICLYYTPMIPGDDYENSETCRSGFLYMDKCSLLEINLFTYPTQILGRQHKSKYAPSFRFIYCFFFISRINNKHVLRQKVKIRIPSRKHRPSKLPTIH
jgi:hypothetical protein